MNKYDYVFNKLKDRAEANLLPGFSVFISKDGKEEYRNTYLYPENAIYRLASMTKPITAVAALKAQELGLINIYDPISKYLDGFSKMKIGKMENGKPVFDSYATREITIKDILHHQSGLGSDVVGFYQVDHRKKPDTLKEAIEDIKTWYLDFDPGTKSMYSGLTALDVLAYIIELTSHMPFQDFINKFIFEPLEMVDTTFKLNDQQKKRLVPMYTMIGDLPNQTMALMPVDSFSGFDAFKEGYPSGSAGLMSTLEDYSHFAMMLAAKGIYKGKRIIKEESVIKMMKDVIELPMFGVNEVTNWGYAVMVRGKKTDNQPLKAGSFGWSGAYSTHFFVNIEDNTAVVMMTNVNNDGGSESPNHKILESAYALVSSK